jgi:PKD domain-containing protein
MQRVARRIIPCLLTAVVIIAQLQLAARAAAPVTLSSNGISPGAISLTWTQSNDLTFQSYTVQYATQGANGPWTIYATITDISRTSEFAHGFTPRSDVWWQIIDTDLLGSAVSNTLHVTQPSVAQLSYTQLNSTSLQLTWNNPATYGGMLTFGSYQLQESFDSGDYTTIVTINDLSTLNYIVNVASSSTYGFILITTDQCKGCTDGNEPSTSNSNPIAVTTALGLAASVTANPTTPYTSQSVIFSCAAAGGSSPYTYNWTFGDGAKGTGQTTSHTYTTVGNKTVTCNVADTAGHTAAVNFTLSIRQAPPNGIPPTGSLGLPLWVLGFLAFTVLVVVIGIAIPFRGKSRKLGPSSGKASSPVSPKRSGFCSGEPIPSK